MRLDSYRESGPRLTGTVQLDGGGYVDVVFDEEPDALGGVRLHLESATTTLADYARPSDR